jgi:hypothetical protein
MIDYQATGISDNNTWMGPFLACPENEVVDAFEVNFSFPSGHLDSTAKAKNASAIVSGKFSTVFMVLDLAGRASRGFTRLKTLTASVLQSVLISSPGLVEVRCRRRNEQVEQRARLDVLARLRGRLLARPSSYAGVTLMGVTVETGANWRLSLTAA